MIKQTHHAFIGFFSRVDPHVDEQLVASVEGFVASHAAGPETGKLFAFALVDVHLLDVPHQLLLAAVSGTAVDPVTRLVLLGHRLVLSYGSVEPREMKLGAVLTVVALEGPAHVEHLPLLVVDLKRFPLTRREIICRLLFDRVVLFMYLSLLMRRLVAPGCIRESQRRGKK